MEMGQNGAKRIQKSGNRTKWGKVDLKIEMGQNGAK